MRTHAIKIIVKITSLFVLLYIVVVSLALKYFLSELVFKKIEEGSTSESSRYSVKYHGDEALIREYLSEVGSGVGARCAFYFPGQGGGIPKYEKEIFQHALARGVSIYAISFPGYEGAAGNSTYSSVFKTGKMAVEYVNDNTACTISDSVFIGRSLGSVIALKIAAAVRPRALLLDSTATSLSVVVRNEMQKSLFLKPASILPIAMLMEFNPKMMDVMSALPDTPIVIFQGELDRLTPYAGIAEFSKHYKNIELIKVSGATHSTAHVDAGTLYFDKLETLLSVSENDN